MEKILKKQFILGVGITTENEDKILEYVIKSLDNTDDSYYIVTPNPEIVVHATKDSGFKNAVNQARIALPDGVGITIASRLLNKKLIARITGVDFMGKLCKSSVNLSKESVKKPISIGFLGAGPGVAERVAECLIRKYPNLNVVFVDQEWGKEGFIKAHKRFGGTDSHIDLLFVAFGFPKQEQWMAEHIRKVPVTVMMGVGGAFDYISGEVTRAPKIFQSLGLEWLFRLLRQPWRWRRQLALLTFVSLILKERFATS
jgi:N-acetylglucosaminyldiphosphoundecaprenol N-acetyl-beta-D-mannosaminyltransferase